MLVVKKVADADGIYAVVSGMQNFDNYPAADWIRNPSTAAVRDLAPKYWKPNRMMPQIIVPKSTAEIAAVDKVIEDEIKVAKAMPGRTEYGQEYPPFYQHRTFRNPTVLNGRTFQVMHTFAFDIPADADYKMILAYSYTMNNNRGDLILTMTAAGMGLGAGDVDDFFYLRIEPGDASGAARSNLDRQLGTNQEHSASFIDVHAMTKGTKTFQFRTRVGSAVPASIKYGVWDFYFSLQRVSLKEGHH